MLMAQSHHINHFRNTLRVILNVLATLDQPACVCNVTGIETCMEIKIKKETRIKKDIKVNREIVN